MENPNTTNQHSTNEDLESPLLKEALPKKHFQYLFAYTVALIGFFSWLFFNQLNKTPFLSKSQADSLLTNYPRVIVKTDTLPKNTKLDDSSKVISKTNPKPSNISTKTARIPKADYTNELKEIMLCVLLLMLFSGVLGGSLSNLRGFFYHYLYDGFFPKAKEIPYYVRPIMGALTGLFMFFVGSFFNSTMSYNSNIPLWVTMTGSIPSLAFAFLAGFASLELMSRLKQIAESLFGYKVAAVPNKSVPPKTDPAGDNITFFTESKSRGLINTLLVPNILESNDGCTNPLPSLTDVYFVDDLEADVTLKISDVLGQIAMSKVTLDNLDLGSHRDNFELSLGKGKDLIGNPMKILRITTLIIDATEGATTVGMQVSINDTIYTPLCSPMKDKKFTFFTDITFFN